MESHLESCQFEAIRPFIEMTRWRLDQLEAENAGLRTDLAVTRDQLNAVRADLTRDIATIAPPMDLLPHIDRLTGDTERLGADIQSVTAEVASMDLRHNMAVMNESFRMREELQGVRSMCQVMQSQILYLTERLKEVGLGRGMPAMPPPPPIPSKPMDGFAAASERFAEAISGTKGASGSGGVNGRPLARRPSTSSARSSSADGSERHGRQEMKL